MLFHINLFIGDPRKLRLSVVHLMECSVFVFLLHPKHGHVKHLLFTNDYFYIKTEKEKS